MDSSVAVYSKKEKKDLGTWGRKSRWKIEGPGERVTHRAGGVQAAAVRAAGNTFRDVVATDFCRQGYVRVTDTATADTKRLVTMR